MSDSSSETPTQPDQLAQQEALDANPNVLGGPRPWVFSESELAAGLRRLSGDSALQIVEMQEREVTQRLPAVGRLRGLQVKAQGIEGAHDFDLVIKEPHGSTHTGAAGAGLREVSVYTTLKEHIPVRMPDLVAASPKGDWLILTHLAPGRRPDKWQAADYLLATEQLAVLHDRFWGLGEDLRTYSWLEKPLDTDRDIHAQAALQDSQQLVANASSLLNLETDIVQITEKIMAQMDTITAGLKQSPFTLLHGDYWPGNIHIHPHHGITIFDWEDAAVGPGILDVLSFIQGSSWYFAPLPLSAKEITQHYRSRLAQRGSHTYEDEEFETLWDYAVMWTFVEGWVRNLANIPNSLLQLRLAALEEFLFRPLRQAVERRLD